MDGVSPLAAFLEASILVLGDVVEWHGAQQVAYIIHLGTKLRDAIADTPTKWAEAIRDREGRLLPSGLDPAFYGRHSLLNTDQGIRGFLSVTNDLSVECRQMIGLGEWVTDDFGRADDLDAISSSVHSLPMHRSAKFINDLTEELVQFDWRTASAPALNEEERTTKLTFRGSGGYREIRRRILMHLTGGDSQIAEPAEMLIEKLGLNPE